MRDSVKKQIGLQSAGTPDGSAADDPAWGQWLACPECGGALRAREEKLFCHECQLSWPIIDGVPHFVEEFPYWGEISLKHMQEVNRCAQIGSWKSALLDASEPAVRRASQMILNLERANWQWLLNLPPESRVLDLGAGTGTIALA